LLASDLPIALPLLGLAFLAALWLLAGRSRGSAPYLAKPLLTPWERAALEEIRAQLAPGLHACPQVRLADFIGVAGDAERNRQAFNRICAKSVDFAIVETATGRIVLVIELDDRSHAREDRLVRDAFLDTVLKTTRIPVLHVRPGQRIDLDAALHGGRMAHPATHRTARDLGLRFNTEVLPMPKTAASGRRSSCARSIWTSSSRCRKSFKS
jgi:hypothetical protein